MISLGYHCERCDETIVHAKLKKYPETFPKTPRMC